METYRPAATVVDLVVAVEVPTEAQEPGAVTELAMLLLSRATEKLSLLLAAKEAAVGLAAAQVAAAVGKERELAAVMRGGGPQANGEAKTT